MATIRDKRSGSDPGTRLKLSKPHSANVSWLNGTGTQIAYCGFLLIGRLIFGFIMEDGPNIWTAWNLTHFLITFLLLHWIKGDPYDKGSNLRLTLWEQVDQGVQFTTAKKFLMIIQIVCFIITMHATIERPSLLLVNSFAFAVIMVAKLPQMYRVRIFGINA